MRRPWLKRINLSTTDFCKITNDKVDPKVLCFLQDIIVNSADAIKSCLSQSCCDKLNNIEDMFPSTLQPNDPESTNCIAGCVSNLTIDQT